MKQTIDKHAQTLNELKASLSADSSRQLQLVMDRAANELAALKREHQSMLELQSSQHTATVKALNTEHDNELKRRDMNALRQRDEAVEALRSVSFSLCCLLLSVQCTCI
jgi:hypothetical protein